MHMNTWRSVLSLTVAGLLLAGPALAQSSAPSTTDTPKSGPTGQDPTKPADSSSPAAAPSTEPKSDASRPDAKKSDAQKADTQKPDAQKKSDALKSEGTKSDAQKSDSKAAAVRGGRDQVKAAQQALKDKGHDPGAIDGAMGPQTQSALKDFQKAQGLTETGRLDSETMAKLGVPTKADQAESSSPSASPKTTPGGAVRQEPAQDKPAPTGKSQTR
jgi:murein L,D-transpeptidase YcbB/YkuD